MKKSELRQLIKELILEQAGPTRQPSRPGSMAEICAAAAALDRIQTMGGPENMKRWKLWQRFKHAIRHILGLEDSCPGDGGGGAGDDIDLDDHFPTLYP
tara:strand:- start:193 stop:489 length:297 start_codon:yes stop_codon:yes gene_type:complete